MLIRRRRRSAALTGAVLAAAFKAMFTTLKKDTAIQIKEQSPEDAVAAQLRVIDGLEAAHNGLWLSHLGGEYRAPN